MEEFQREAIIAALKAKGVGCACSRCGSINFNVLDFAILDSQSNTDAISHGGPTISTAIIVCQTCGLITQHDTKTLFRQLDVSQKPSAESMIFSPSDPRIQSQIGTKDGALLHFKAPAGGYHMAVYGPHIDLPEGTYRAELALTVSEPNTKGVTIEVCHRSGNKRIYSRPCFMSELRVGLIRCGFYLSRPVEKLEMRLRVPGGLSGCITQLSFSAVAKDFP